MKKARWEKMVEATEFYSDGLLVCRSADVRKLLARQHAAFVRLVKKACTHGPNFRGGMVPCEDGEWINVKDLLAALATRGGKK